DGGGRGRVDGDAGVGALVHRAVRAGDGLAGHAADEEAGAAGADAGQAGGDGVDDLDPGRVRGAGVVDGEGVGHRRGDGNARRSGLGDAEVGPGPAAVAHEGSGGGRAREVL